MVRGRRAARGARGRTLAFVSELSTRLGGEPERLEIVRPSLEDIYLELVASASALAAEQAKETVR
nr:hypothetical protein GCM10025699_18080 [Microbacterium flavescens]